ncbi:MAG: DUF6488 family protein [Spongiibacteraceae bacterium]
MKVLSTILMLMTLLTSQSLFAHSDHAHGPISESAAQSLALDVATNLSSRDAGLGFGQLPNTWASVPAKNVAMTKKGNGYYIVSVLNESEKKTLYILMSDGGEVFDANFTGEFEGVK